MIASFFAQLCIISLVFSTNQGTGAVKRNYYESITKTTTVVKNIACHENYELRGNGSCMSSSMTTQNTLRKKESNRKPDELAPCTSSMICYDPCWQNDFSPQQQSPVVEEVDEEDPKLLSTIGSFS
jgi:hypothetical protein